MAGTWSSTKKEYYMLENIYQKQEFKKESQCDGIPKCIDF
jgi:hypothetical protein